MEIKACLVIGQTITFSTLHPVFLFVIMQTSTMMTRDVSFEIAIVSESIPTCLTLVPLLSSVCSWSDVDTAMCVHASGLDVLLGIWMISNQIKIQHTHTRARTHILVYPTQRGTFFSTYVQRSTLYKIGILLLSAKFGNNLSFHLYHHFYLTIS